MTRTNPRGGDAAAALHEASPETARLARVATRDTVEIHVAARPDAGGAGFPDQARSAYASLLESLRRAGVRPRDVIAEKVFLSDLASQAAVVKKIQRESHWDGGSPVPTLPATTLVQQPPARPGELLEIQAYAILPADGSAAPVRWLRGLPRCHSGKVVEIGDLRLACLANVTGGGPGDGRSFARQAAAMFRRAEGCLKREGLSFRDVVRTWIYVADIDRDYTALNEARRSFFRSRGVTPCPASTGIQGIPHPPDRRCGLDLRAIAAGAKVGIRPLHAPTMNEAPSYGADFSRGMRVDLPDRCILFLSGTASIDANGEVVRPGDFAGQADRMLVNIEQLLAGQGARWDHLVQAVTYLKDPADLPAFERTARRRGLPDGLPNTLCVADICRPEWLCEMEAVAVLT
jgi:enamine deaminase RidA (YjgF/YER057c/UK114 family)